MENKRILRNSAICNHCKEEIISKHGHDYVTCKCGTVSVDGGQNYLRRLFKENADYKDTSIYDDGEHNTRRENLKWGVNYTKEMKRLPQTEWRIIKDLETEHIEAILDGGYARNNSYYEQIFKDELYWRTL